MYLHEIKSPKGSRKKKRIVGRGQGSGLGKTCGRGENGQRSRSGRWAVGGSEGGQMPLIRRLPKVGFRSHRPNYYQVVNVGDLNKFDKGVVVDAKTLKSKGLISSARKAFKILGTGELKTALTINAQNVSKTAQEKITKAGGTIMLPKIEDAKVVKGQK